MDKLVLIGFMGAGKSAAGRSLAREFAWKFFDTDTLALVLSGEESINDIFDKYGEQHFRDLEVRAGTALQQETKAIISTGGGFVMNTQAMQALKSPNTCVLYIRVSFEELQIRLRGNTTRPLFRDVDKARELYQSRLETYQNYADLIVDADGFTPSEASDKIVTALKEGKII